jgi:glycosyltransferase involved in cell wall biosynthesis
VSADAPRLSLVLACYNEAEHLEGSFPQIKEVLDDLRVPYEVLFVDDMSRDRTREIIAAIARTHADADIRVLLHERNQGRGATVCDGFRLARGEIAGFLDVDLEVHARYIPSLVKAIEKGADVATVRRVYAFQLRSIVRYVLSRGYGWLQRRLLDTRVRDTETG